MEDAISGVAVYVGAGGGSVTTAGGAAQAVSVNIGATKINSAI
jgi:hypothetical protein